MASSGKDRFRAKLAYQIESRGAKALHMKQTFSHEFVYLVLLLSRSSAF